GLDPQARIGSRLCDEWNDDDYNGLADAVAVGRTMKGAARERQLLRGAGRFSTRPSSLALPPRRFSRAGMHYLGGAPRLGAFAPPRCSFPLIVPLSSSSGPPAPHP